MGGHCKISDDQRTNIKALRNDDPKRWTHYELARQFGVSDTTIMRVLHNGYDDRRTFKVPTVLEMPVRIRQRIEADARLLARAIPPDTRDLTGQIMGDPRVGRSALDRRIVRAG